MYYVIRYKNDKNLKANIIGAYGATFNARSNFVYRTYTKCQGYYIRRTKWKAITDSDDHKVIRALLKEQVRIDYEESVSKRVETEKKNLLAKWKKRSDYNAFLVLRAEEYPGEVSKLQ